MDKLNINLQKKDFLSFFLYKHKKNLSIISMPICLILVVFAFILKVIVSGFDFLAACYLLCIISFIFYVFTLFKVCKSYANQPFDLYLTNDIYQMSRRDENGKPKVTFKQGIEKFFCYDETKNYFYLFVDKTTTFILPKSIFTEEELTKVTTTFSKRIKKRKVSLPVLLFHIILSISALAFIIVFIVGVIK